MGAQLSANNAIYAATDRLRAGNCPLSDQQVADMVAYGVLVEGQSAAFGLASRQDEELIRREHIPDCLSLVPYCPTDDSAHVDIGTGGGLPGMVLAIAQPFRQFTLIERSERKASFLRLAVRRLGLGNVTVVCGVFPSVSLPGSVGSVTARAVERPERLAGALVQHWPAGAVLLCQSPRMVETFSEGFHVERVQDGWEKHFRRGPLWLVRKCT